MRIASVRALSCDAGFQNQSLQTTRIASPMARWPQYRDRRSSWMWPSEKVFVRIESQDGAVGWSCTNGGEVVALLVERHLGRFLTGGGPVDIEETWEIMTASLMPNDRSGFAMMAVAAIDIALWDLRAKLAGRSLAELLGGPKSDFLDVYATTTAPEKLAGGTWWGLKAAMPHGPESGDSGMAENIRLMRRFREAAGAEGRIMLDAFMAWDADYTLRFAQGCRDLDLCWIEDPLPPVDIAGYRRLRDGLGADARIALGNFCFHRWDCLALIEEGLVDILQPDVAWAGGITECLRILEIADAAGIPVILHNSCEQPWALALAAAHRADAVVEFVDRGEDSPLYDLAGEAAMISEGRVKVPAGGNCPPQTVVERFAGAGGRTPS